jgi:cell division protein FtsB|tara:strand:- start:1451 stop:1687 length:237 start_codon:yes stop_codon:yes gene_type:complete
MSNILILLIGVFVGTSFGIISYAFLTLRKYGEMEDEIQRLRATRQILKEEIFRLEKNYKPTKPTPRKYRKKPKPIAKS